MTVGGRSPLGTESGMVSAETAAVLPVLVVLLTVCIAAISVARLQLRCTDAAREAARVVARGEPARAQAVAEIAAGQAVAIVESVAQADGVQLAHVEASVTWQPIGWLPAATVHESASVLVEAGDPGG